MVKHGAGGIRPPFDAGYSPARRRKKASRGAGAQALRLAAAYLYPPACPGCGEPIETPRGLCPACWRDTVFIADPRCLRCGAPVIAEDPEAVCDGCAHAPPAWDRGAAALVYDGAGRRLTLALKHGDRLDIAHLAAGWMMRAAPDLVASAEAIAPAPLHWTRLARRRYNQAGELARALALGAGKRATLRLDLLRRTRATGTQDGRSRAGRLANVADAFRLTTGGAAAVAGREVLLIDDVMTTGATLSACAEACRRGGARAVNVLVLARVARADWPS